MSLQECTQALQTIGQIRINGGDFSAAELEAAAAEARASRARLFVYNLKGLSCAEIGRIAEAGGRQVYFDDIRLI